MGGGVMSDLVVAVPVLGRPERLRLVLEAFSDVRVLFLPDEFDVESVEELERLGAWFSFAPVVDEFGVATYESKVNHAFLITEEPYLLYAADDVVPQSGWLARALELLEVNPRVGLLATNDESHHLVKAGKLATHGIVRRSYVFEFGSASLPDAGLVFYEGYRHWGCDAEASYVARGRDAFLFAPDVRLTHVRRKLARKRGGMDKTYELGAAFADRDRALLRLRCPGWPEVEAPR
jgi:hypothetical protein